MNEEIKKGDDVGEVRNELPVKICEFSEGPDLFDEGGGFSFLYGFKLLSIYLNLSLSDDHA